MIMQQETRLPLFLSILIAVLTVAQVGGSGVLVYFIINEWILGRAPDSAILLFCIVLLILVDLFLLYWLFHLIEIIFGDEA